MKARELGPQRLTNLHVAGSRCSTPAQVVQALGAMQAQDHAGGLWAIGLRVPGAKLADVEGAIARREIVRSWPMRGTLHFVAAQELGWLLDLLGARVLKATEKRRVELELDDATLRKVEKLLHKELSVEPRTRDELREAFVRAKITPDAGRLYHCLLHFSLRQQICFANHRGKQPTFALFERWIARSERLQKDEALAELATRYYTSHGPATQQDLMRWAGLSASEAKQGIASARGLQDLSIEGKTYWTAREQPPPHPSSKQTFLLPGFDEYILGYGDRSAILDAEHKHKIVPGANGVFMPTIVHGGKVLGTWKAMKGKLEAAGFATLTAAQQKAFARAGAQYAAFFAQ